MRISKPMNGILLLSMFGALVACDSSFVNSGSSVISKNNAQVATVQIAPAGARTAYHANALQIGNDMLADVKVSLSKNTSLTAGQIDFVIEKAKDKVHNHVNQLVVTSASLALVEDTTTDTTTEVEFDENTISTDKSPLLLIAPDIIGGSMGALSDERFPINSPSERSDLAANFAKSGFEALEGSSSGLDVTDFSGMTSRMMGSAMATFDSIGLGADSASLGSEAITKGAMGALTQAGVPSDQMSTISRSVVSGVIKNMDKVTLTPEQLVKSISSTTTGAVGAIKNLGLGKDVGSALVGNIAGDTVGSMKSLKVDTAVLMQTIQTVSTNIVAALPSSGFAASDNFASTVSLITGQMASSLKAKDLDKSVISQGVSSLMAGAISGLAKSGLTQDQIASTGVVKSAIGGAISKLGETGLSKADMALTMGSAVSGAVSSLDDFSGASGTQFNGFMSSLMSGSAENLAAAGFTSVSDLSVGLKNLTSGMVDALPSAGINQSNFADMAYQISSAAGSSVGKLGLTSASELKTVLGDASQGMSEAFSGFISLGLITEENLKATAVQQSSGSMSSLADLAESGLIAASDYSSFAETISSSTFKGYAYGGMSSTFFDYVSADMLSGFQDSLGALGVSSDDLSNFANNFQDELTNNQNLSNSLSTGEFLSCATEYPDSMSDDEMIPKLKPHYQNGETIMCEPSEGAFICPVFRASGDSASYVYWFYQYFGDRLLCQADMFFDDSDHNGGGGGGYYQQGVSLLTYPYGQVGVYTETLFVMSSDPNIVSYRYKVGPFETTDCYIDINYSVVTDLANPFSFNTADDVNYAICLTGVDLQGNLQDTQTAFWYNWYRFGSGGGGYDPGVYLSCPEAFPDSLSDSEMISLFSSNPFQSCRPADGTSVCPIDRFSGTNSMSITWYNYPDAQGSFICEGYFNSGGGAYYLDVVGGAYSQAVKKGGVKPIMIVGGVKPYFVTLNNEPELALCGSCDTYNFESDPNQVLSRGSYNDATLIIRDSANEIINLNVDVRDVGELDPSFDANNSGGAFVPTSIYSGLIEPDYEHDFVDTEVGKINDVFVLNNVNRFYIAGDAKLGYQDLLSMSRYYVGGLYDDSFNSLNEHAQSLSASYFSLPFPENISLSAKVITGSGIDLSSPVYIAGELTTLDAISHQPLSSRIFVARMVNGNLDPTFGNGEGYFTSGFLTNAPGYYNTIRGLHVLSDGTLLIAGTGDDRTQGSPVYQMFVMKVDENGSGEPVFGSSGIANLGNGVVNHMAVDSIDNIFVVGQTNSTYVSVLKLSSTGQVTSTFASEFSFIGSAKKVKILADDSFIVVGDKLINGDHFAGYVMKLDSAGAFEFEYLDDFGTDTNVSYDDIDVQTDNKIVLVGNTTSFISAVPISRTAMVVRLDEFGGSDSTFSSYGTAYFQEIEPFIQLDTIRFVQDGPYSNLIVSGSKSYDYYGDSSPFVASYITDLYAIAPNAGTGTQSLFTYHEDGPDGGGFFSDDMVWDDTYQTGISAFYNDMVIPDPVNDENNFIFVEIIDNDVGGSTSAWCLSHAMAYQAEILANPQNYGFMSQASWEKYYRLAPNDSWIPNTTSNHNYMGLAAEHSWGIEWEVGGFSMSISPNEVENRDINNYILSNPKYPGVPGADLTIKAGTRLDACGF